MSRYLFLVALAVLTGITSYPSNMSDNKDHQLVLLKPTGGSIEAYPIMEIIAETAPEYKRVMDIIDKSAVKDILRLHDLAQNYMVNTGRLNERNPAYLALTENEGGYAKKGFYLINEHNDTIPMLDAGFVDIISSNITADINRIMSFTQLFPHELGHIIYSTIALNDSTDSEYKNVDMHYFPVITDYLTAFNEGFAEMFENISRLNEENDSIIIGINKDVERIGDNEDLWISGYIRDFSYPVRLGFYKASVINWYQKYEDYRRYVHALHPDIKYVYTSPRLRNIEDRLSIRNAGIIKSDKLKNAAQLMATEGFVATFFTQLILSELPNYYQDPDFYMPFLADTISEEINPEHLFSPMENQMMKLYYVIHHHVSKWNTNTNQFADFLSNYIKTFPEEEAEIRSIYKRVTGSEYKIETYEQIWIMVKEHDHNLLVIDPFGAITVPVYTFDLNVAELEDLLTIRGLDEEKAQCIIDHRQANGYFSDLNDLKKVDGLPDEAVDLLISSKFDLDHFNALEEPKLSFSRILITPVKYILSKAGIYLLFLLLFLNLLFLRKRTYRPKKRFILSIRYSLWWLLMFLFVCCVILMTQDPVIWTVLMLITAIGLSGLLFMKNKTKLQRSLSMTILMSIIILLSII